MKTKFNFGDFIIPIELKEVKKNTVCTGCDCTGIIILRDGREHTCPVCDGTGKIRKVSEKKWFPVHSVFGSTYFSVREIAMLDKIAEGEESYRIGNDYYDAADCFANDEEANAECERRNAHLAEI